MSRKKSVGKRREYSAELKEEAVQMLLARPFDRIGGVQPGPQRHKPGLSLEGEIPGSQRTGGDQVGDSGLSTGRGVASRGAGA